MGERERERERAREREREKERERERGAGRLGHGADTLCHEEQLQGGRDTTGEERITQADVQAAAQTDGGTESGFEPHCRVKHRMESGSTGWKGSALETKETYIINRL
jgi:hypothetical protein